jgi:hypothetical protein
MNKHEARACIHVTKLAHSTVICSKRTLVLTMCEKQRNAGRQTRTPPSIDNLQNDKFPQGHYTLHYASHNSFI